MSASCGLAAANYESGSNTTLCVGTHTCTYTNTYRLVCKLHTAIEGIFEGFRAKPDELAGVLYQHLVLHYRMQQEQPAAMNGGEADSKRAVQVLPHELVPKQPTSAARRMSILKSHHLSVSEILPYRVEEDSSGGRCCSAMVIKGNFCRKVIGTYGCVFADPLEFMGSAAPTLSACASTRGSSLMNSSLLAAAGGALRSRFFDFFEQIRTGSGPAIGKSTSSTSCSLILQPVNCSNTGRRNLSVMSSMQKPGVPCHRNSPAEL